jgi:uncharacterized protein (DUF1501 family)
VLRAATAGGVLTTLAAAVTEQAGPAEAAGAVGAVEAAEAAPVATGATPLEVLVVLSLRGGFDGLSAVVPAADPAYAAARPGIGIPAAALLPLDATFGLHPALSPLLPFWRSGALAVVADVGQAAPTRSHFEAMRELERAAPGSSLRTGWMDRLLAALPRTTTFQGAQLGTSKATDAFRGPFPEIAMDRIDRFTLDGTDASTLPAARAVLRSMYGRAPEVIGTPLRVALDAVATTSGLQNAGYTPTNGAVYPTTDVGQALRDVARLITSGAGLQVACVDVGGWDLHAGMGTVGEGVMTRQLGELAAALAAFATDLGARMATVTVLTLSEFGRRVAENGSGGTDHGHGNGAFVLGGAVVGGRVHGRWPGRAETALADGDLPGTTDYRQIVAEIAAKRFGVGAGPVASVFPGLRLDPLGIVRPLPA